MTTSPTKKETARPAPADAARQFLELYYPIHYQAGIRVEDAMRGERLGRHQAAVLWLIHSEGEAGQRLSRRRIANALQDWFGISNAAVTKAIRGLASGPDALLSLREDPDSARAQIVSVTPDGQREIDMMIERATAYVQTIVDHMDERQAIAGIAFFEKIRDVVRTQQNSDAGD